MADSKIDFSFDNLHFSCKGDNAWVERQLNNVLSRIPSLLAVHKKGENMMEEVIDVQEFTSQPAKPPKASKPPKEAKPPKASKPKKTSKPVKDEKAVEDKKEVVEEPVVKAPGAPKIQKAPKAAKSPKAPRIKAPKAPKAAKVPKEKILKAPKEKPLKVPKMKAPKLPKVKKIVEKTDSPLFQFLVEKKAEKNQVRKYLATAVYLAKGNEQIKLSTPVISKALKSLGIEKLQNASDCLNKNEKRGYCIKEGKSFIITENGFLSIG